MTPEGAQWIVLTAGAYLAGGAVFGCVCLVRGLHRLDDAAKAMPWPARLLVLPGLVALWPLMLAKWLRHSQPPVA
jgi:hypothetical protein